jgi:hypothetical protein
MLLLLDTYFARADTANPDSGDVHPKRATVESFHGAFGVGRNQAGFKAKKPTRSPSSAPHLARYLHKGWRQLISRRAEHSRLTSFLADASF